MGIIDRQQKMLVPAFAHEVADALVHRHAGRSHQARHASHDAVIPRGHHVRASSQNRDELKHVVVVRSENWKCSAGIFSRRPNPTEKNKLYGTGCPYKRPWSRARGISRSMLSPARQT